MKRAREPLPVKDWMTARRRTARVVIRFAADNTVRDCLLDVLGLTYEDACPVPNGAKTALEPELVGAGSTGTEIVLDDNAPVVAGHASGSGGSGGSTSGGENSLRMKSQRRRCPSCTEVKDSSEFYGNRAKCKTCHQQMNSRAQRRRRAERPKGRPGRPPKPRVTVAEKRCSACDEVKHRSFFHADARNPDGLRSECAGCSAERKARRREKAVA